MIKVSTKEESSEWNDLSPIFIQYYFKTGKEEIIVPCHGNSKKNTPYFRSKESTKLAIKANVKPLAVTSVFGTKRIFNEMMQEKGGLTKIRSPADVPRNREQIRNFRKNSASTVSTPDDLTVVMYKSKEQSKTKMSGSYERYAFHRKCMYFCAIEFS